MIADFHAQAIAATQGGRLVGVATRNPENARAFAAKHGVPFATTSVEELVARPDVQVVCITTPSGAHLEPALAAVRAGKHVVIEKPIEITTERADELLRAAEELGIDLSGAPLPIEEELEKEAEEAKEAAKVAAAAGDDQGDAEDGK